MAIVHIQVEVLSTARGQSAVGAAAYICRERWTSHLTGETYNFLPEEVKQARETVALEAAAAAIKAENKKKRRRKTGEPKEKKPRKKRRKSGVIGRPMVILPSGAPKRFNDPLTLWKEVEAAEMTVDRETGFPRPKKRATLAKHVILALPKELTDDERRDLVREWVKHAYPGVAVMAVIHDAEDPEKGNHHAHLLVSTRTLDEKGFGNKATYLDPKFSNSGGLQVYVEPQGLQGQWRDFQNRFFRDRGIPLVVDAFIEGGGVHWGDARFIADSVRVENDEITRAAARERILDPKNLLADATKNRATFTRRWLRWYLKAHDVLGREASDLIDRVIADPGVIPLYDPESGKALNLYTTNAARNQERLILETARTLLGRKPTQRQLAKMRADMPGRIETMTFSGEQRVAYEHLLLSGRIGICRGIAGAGKSHVIKGAKATYEAAGFQVVGLAPTNKVVDTMRTEGFAHANTLHSERYRLEHPRRNTVGWNANTVVIVDEAGMIDSGMMEWLVRTAAATGAKLILVGDEAQLTSVERGGMFAILKKQLGAVELKEVRRQHEGWAKEASLALSEGRIPEALEAYAARDRIHWADDPDGATDLLVARWDEDRIAAHKAPRFVYVATNDRANEVNNRLQAASFAGRLDFLEFDCVRGKIKLFPEDRVQFHETDKKLGIMNGAAGTVVSMAADEIVVETDAGATIVFDPTSFTGWGLGYAGTVYRGQGQTLPRTYALYDHVTAWSRRSAYVALTRHRMGFDLFVPRTLARDLGQLGRQMSRGDGSEASLTYATRDEAGLLFPKATIKAVQEHGAPRQVDAGDATPDALADHWQVAPYRRFAADYSALKRAAAAASPYSPIHAHFPSAEEAARRRGILPKTGYRDPRCLKDFIPRNNSLIRRLDPELVPAKGELDVRDIVPNVENLEYAAWFAILRRLRQLDHHVLRAIENQLDVIAKRINNVMAKADLLSDLVVARHFVRFASLLKRRNADGTLRRARTSREFRVLRTLNPVPRQTHGRFHLRRNHPIHGSILADVLGFVSARARRQAMTNARQNTAGRNATPANAPTPAQPQRRAPTVVPPSPRQMPPLPRHLPPVAPSHPAAPTLPPQRPAPTVVAPPRPTPPVPRHVPPVAGSKPAAPTPPTQQPAPAVVAPPPQTPAVPRHVPPVVTPKLAAPTPPPQRPAPTLPKDEPLPPRASRTNPPQRKRDDGPAL
jgi:Ti-type conjugative transfer relaxase TraA